MIYRLRRVNVYEDLPSMNSCSSAVYQKQDNYLFLNMIIKYIKQSPHNNADMYDSFIKTFRSVEKKMNRKVLNSFNFKSYDDEPSVMKDLKFELYRVFIRRCGNDALNFEELDDLLFGIGH